MRTVAPLLALALLAAGCSSESPYSEREQAFLEIADVPDDEEVSAIEIGKSTCTIYETVDLQSERHRLIYGESSLVLDNDQEKLQRIVQGALAELCPEVTP